MWYKTNKEKILSIRVKDLLFTELEAKAQSTNTKVSKYIRKLIKTDLDGKYTKNNNEQPNFDASKFTTFEHQNNDLLRQNQEIKEQMNKTIRERDDLLRKNRELESTNESLTQVKNDLLKELEFAKKGSGVLIKLFENAMKDSAIMEQIKDLLTDANGSPSQDYKMILATKKLVEGG